MERPEMEQEPLFYEDIYDAMRHAVQRLGGAKRVGSQIWPDKSADKAGEYLLACLNRDRAEKLSVEQFLWLRREARRIGCHTIAAFENQDGGYAPPQPIEPADEAAELMRLFVESVKKQEQISNRLALLTQQPLKAVK